MKTLILLTSITLSFPSFAYIRECKTKGLFNREKIVININGYEDTSLIFSSKTLNFHSKLNVTLHDSLAGNYKSKPGQHYIKYTWTAMDGAFDGPNSDHLVEYADANGNLVKKIFRCNNK
jgi:hypothetical protein